MNLKYFKVDSTVKNPVRASEWAACYDLHASLHNRTDGIKCIDAYNTNGALTPILMYDQKINEYNYELEIPNNTRALIPTGLIFDIPEGYSLRLHPRSGLSWKYGLTLINAEGIIDSDYYHETFVALHNTSDHYVVVRHNDRICQMELVAINNFELEETDVQPEQKTDRNGGFGSTGQ